MPGDRFTPDELKALVELGELTQDDLPMLHPADRLTAGKVMFERDPNSLSVPGGMPLPGPNMLSGVANAAGKVMSKIPSPSTAGLGSLAAQMGVDALGQKLGLPWWITGPISHKIGRMGQSKAAPTAASSPKPSGKPPAAPPRGSNLERHGNLTNPGPDAHRGGGGPSRPSGPTPNPLDPKPSTDSRISGLPPSGDRRSPNRPSSATGNDPVYEELIKKFGGRPGSRRPPTSSFDEADKRKVTFGGLNSSSTGYKRPQDRKPLSKREIEQMIKNIMDLAEK